MRTSLSYLGPQSPFQLLPCLQNCGAKLFRTKYFNIIKKSNHGVAVEIVFGNVLDNALGHFRRGDNFNLRVRGFRVSWPHTPCSPAMHDAVRVTGRTHFLDFFHDPVSDGVVADDGYPLHRICLHAMVLPLLLDFVLLHLVVQQATIDLQAVGGLGFVSVGIVESLGNQALFQFGD
jgi:hypothetical protein